MLTVAHAVHDPLAGVLMCGTGGFLRVRDDHARMVQILGQLVDEHARLPTHRSGWLPGGAGAGRGRPGGGGGHVRVHRVRLVSASGQFSAGGLLDLPQFRGGTRRIHVERVTQRRARLATAVATQMGQHHTLLARIQVTPRRGSHLNQFGLGCFHGGLPHSLCRLLSWLRRAQASQLVDVLPVLGDELTPIRPCGFAGHQNAGSALAHGSSSAAGWLANGSATPVPAVFVVLPPV